MTSTTKGGETRTNATSVRAVSTAKKEQKRVVGVPFEKGKSGNPSGRPKGSKNKIVEDYLTALADDFREHGVGAIVAMREERPSDYVKCVAALVPKDTNLNVGGEAFSALWSAVSSGAFVPRKPPGDDDEDRYAEYIN